jgi:hypothetical protein
MELLKRMWLAGAGILCYWLDVSHRVVWIRFGVTVLNRLVFARDTLVRVAPDYTRELKIVVRRDRAMLVSSEAECKK